MINIDEFDQNKAQSFFSRFKVFKNVDDSNIKLLTIFLNIHNQLIDYAQALSNRRGYDLTEIYNLIVELGEVCRNVKPELAAKYLIACDIFSDENKRFIEFIGLDAKDKEKLRDFDFSINYVMLKTLVGEGILEKSRDEIALKAYDKIMNAIKTKPQVFLNKECINRSDLVFLLLLAFKTVSETEEKYDIAYKSTCEGCVKDSCVYPRSCDDLEKINNLFTDKEVSKHMVKAIICLADNKPVDGQIAKDIINYKGTSMIKDYLLKFFNQEYFNDMLPVELNFSELFSKEVVVDDIKKIIESKKNIFSKFNFNDPEYVAFFALAYVCEFNKAKGMEYFTKCNESLEYHKARFEKLKNNSNLLKMLDKTFEEEDNISKGE